MRAQPHKKNKAPLVIAIVVAVALLGYGVTAYATSLWPFQNSESESSIRDTNSVDYGPPTDQEIEESQNAKKNNYENNGQKNDEKSDNGDKTTTNKRSVNVGISYADVYNGNVEVRAFTGDVVEPGTCTVKITKGDKTITKTSGAFIDASSTQCEPVIIPKSEFSHGTWSVTVTYTSSSSQGTSERIEVTIS